MELKEKGGDSSLCITWVTKPSEYKLFSIILERALQRSSPEAKRIHIAEFTLYQKGKHLSTMLWELPILDINYLWEAYKPYPELELKVRFGYISAEDKDTFETYY